MLKLFSFISELFLYISTILYIMTLSIIFYLSSILLDFILVFSGKDGSDIYILLSTDSEGKELYLS